MKSDTPWWIEEEQPPRIAFLERHETVSSRAWQGGITLAIILAGLLWGMAYATSCGGLA